jgi:hypothetical protein
MTIRDKKKAFVFHQIIYIIIFPYKFCNSFNFKMLFLLSILIIINYNFIILILFLYNPTVNNTNKIQKVEKN